MGNYGQQTYREQPRMGKGLCAGIRMSRSFRIVTWPSRGITTAVRYQLSCGDVCSVWVCVRARTIATVEIGQPPYGTAIGPGAVM